MIAAPKLVRGRCGRAASEVARLLAIVARQRADVRRVVCAFVDCVTTGAIDRATCRETVADA